MPDNASNTAAVTANQADGVHSSIGFLIGVLDEIIDGYASKTAADIAQARKDYEDRRGRVFEDEELWEVWTQAFLEWYMLERAIGDHPPVVEYLLRARHGGDARKAAAARAWLTSYRSLFEVKSLRQGRVALLDLLGGGEFLVAEQRAMAGVSPGDVAELRIIGFEREVLFGRTFCFHPRGTRQAIVDQAQRILSQGGSRREVMDLCASLRIRCLRYRHVSPKRIYEAGTPSPRGRGGGMAAGGDGAGVGSHIGKEP